MSLLHSALLLVLIGLAAGPGHAAEPLGRLFMTPEQRQALDALRGSGGELPADPVGRDPAASSPADGRVVMNGVVRRSRGPDVVWVNGGRTGAPEARIRLRQGPDSANRVTLENAADGSTVRLKPGQFWEPATGRVADCHDCGPRAAAGPIPPAPAEVTADQP